MTNEGKKLLQKVGIVINKMEEWTMEYEGVSK